MRENHLRLPLSAVAVLVSCSLMTPPAAALDNGRPLRTAAARTQGKAGAVRLEVGAAWQSAATPAPLLPTSPEGDLLSLPQLGLRVGLAERVDIEVYGTAWQTLDVPGAGDPDGVGDFSVFVRWALPATDARRYGLGFRVGTKLPNATHEHGLGTNETDFFASLLWSPRLGPCTLHTNLGLAILGDPTDRSGQHDALTYGAALEWPLGDRGATSFLAEVSGLEDSSDSRNSTCSAALGLVHTRGRATLDAALRHGLDAEAGDLGVTLGFAWAFGHSPADRR